MMPAGARYAWRRDGPSCPGTLPVMAILPDLPDLEINGPRLWESLERLGEVGAYTDGRTGLRGVNRPALTDADGAGRQLVKRWFEEAGLEVRVDRVGNCIGRRRGSSES